MVVRIVLFVIFFFFSSRRRHTRCGRDWSSDVCSSDLRTFRIKAKIKNNERLLPNMLAEMHITDLVIDSSVVVPAVSLLKTQKNESYIFVLKKEGENYVAKQVMIEVVSQYQNSAAINLIDTKINAGDLIVSAGGRGISDGDVVRIEIK